MQQKKDQSSLKVRTDRDRDGDKERSGSGAGSSSEKPALGFLIERKMGYIGPLGKIMRERADNATAHLQ